MIVLMSHPLHGRTHVYEVQELERLKKLGWTPEEPAQAKRETSPPAEAPRRRHRRKSA